MPEKQATGTPDFNERLTMLQLGARLRNSPEFQSVVPNYADLDDQELAEQGLLLNPFLQNMVILPENVQEANAALERRPPGARTKEFVGGAVGLGGGALGMGIAGVPGAILGGATAFELADAGIRKLVEEDGEVRDPMVTEFGLMPTPENELVRLGVNLAEGVVTDLAAGRLFKTARNVIGAIRPQILSSAEAMLNRLLPTGGQRSNSILLQIVEDVLASTSKEASIIRSARRGLEVGEEIASELAGTPVTIDNFRIELANTVAGDITGNFRRALALAGLASEDIKVLAKLDGNTLHWPPAEGITTSATGFGPVTIGGAAPPSMRVGAVAIEGPVYLTRVQEVALELQKELNALVGTTDLGSLGKAQQTVTQILAGIHDELSTIMRKANIPGAMQENARLAALSDIPISFNRAWQDKKRLGELAFETLEDGTPKRVQALIVELYDAFDTDITRSLGDPNLWGESAEEAVQLWGEIKSTTTAAYAINMPRNAVDPIKSVILQAGDAERISTALQQDLATIRDPNAFVNSVLDDKNLLARGIDQGRIAVPGLAGELKVTKENLKSYQVMRILHEAQDTATGAFNSGRLLSGWRNFKASPSAQKKGTFPGLFTAAEKRRLDVFFEALAKTQTTLPSASRTAYLAIRGSTLALGTLSGWIFGGSLATAGASGLTFAAALLGGHTIGRFTNSRIGSSILSLALKGEALGMSVQQASQALGMLARGEPVTLQFIRDEDGALVEIQGTVGEDGRFVADLGTGTGGARTVAAEAVQFQQEAFESFTVPSTQGRLGSLSRGAI